MSVLDKAIVKAFERRRLSATAAAAANEPRRATDIEATLAEVAALTEAPSPANAVDSVEPPPVEGAIASATALSNAVAPAPPASVIPPPAVVSPPPDEISQPLAKSPIPSQTAVIPPAPATIPTEPLVPQADVPAHPTALVPPPPPLPLPLPAAPARKVADNSNPLPTSPRGPAVPVEEPTFITKNLPPAAIPRTVTNATFDRGKGDDEHLIFGRVENKPAAVSTAPIAAEPAIARDWKWPEICEQLDQFTGDGFRQLAKHLQFAAAQGHKVLAFVSSKPGAGRTSVLLTLARILALEGRTDVLLIDADRRRPDLAKLTGLTPAAGLCEVLYGQATLRQAVVSRGPGNVSLLPLPKPVSEGEWQTLAAPLRTLVKQVRRDHDMVLVDAGVFGPETKLGDCWLRDAADAVITISRQLTGKNAAHEVLNWKQIGIESLGVIETFS